MSSSPHEAHMRRALELASRGEGLVEPNPMVGCVIADGESILGEGWHQKFGGPHAEIHALEAASEQARGATAYVSLEPCCHHGKTPPCSQALIDAGVARVVIGMRDSFPEVDGGGIRQLQDAGIEVTVGVLEDEARELNAPYLKLIETGRPWVIAKWAMTLDGRIASRTGSSQWISGDASRAIVHQLRGRVDAIIVGRGTVEADDPMLTARLPDGAPPRIATRVVFDSNASLSPTSKLVSTAGEAPVMIVVGPNAPSEHVERLQAAGCEVLLCDSEDRTQKQSMLLDELGVGSMTNVLVEGGAGMLGSFFDADEIDEFHAFIAPKLIGGQTALSPIHGAGIAEMCDARRLRNVTIEQVDDDIYVRGRVDRSA